MSMLSRVPYVNLNLIDASDRPFTLEIQISFLFLVEVKVTDD